MNEFVFQVGKEALSRCIALGVAELGKRDTGAFVREMLNDRPADTGAHL
ncbi:hypothetical protein SAMN05216386_1606 [Nitrosospira briensis]|uniref:Uncharacterized protein n=1 Tax=Nitrosospira briensis TaxID=35799 RepID=A0A1I5B002_9PROT|nr:hypothetical protein SAMN05216386_1606 [Nitrosospira briensis]